MARERFLKRPRRYIRKVLSIIFILFIFITIFFISTSTKASRTEVGFQIDYKKDDLTINVKDVALGSLLNILREKTGIEFSGISEFAQVPVSLNIGPIPLIEGLRRVLNHFNHAILVDSNNKPIKVVILGYAGPENLPISRDIPGVQSEQTSIPSSRREGMGIRQSIRETRRPTSFRPLPSSEVIPFKKEKDMAKEPPSLETMVIKPSAGEGMSVKHSSAPMMVTPSKDSGMVITPATGGMIVRPGTDGVPLPGSK